MYTIILDANLTSCGYPMVKGSAREWVNCGY